MITFSDLHGRRPLHDPFPHYRYFEMGKHYFHYILRKVAPKNSRAFCLDKRLTCDIVVEIFVTSGVFFINST